MYVVSMNKSVFCILLMHNDPITDQLRNLCRWTQCVLFKSTINQHVFSWCIMIWPLASWEGVDSYFLSSATVVPSDPMCVVSINKSVFYIFLIWSDQFRRCWFNTVESYFLSSATVVPIDPMCVVSINQYSIFSWSDLTSLEGVDSTLLNPISSVLQQLCPLNQCVLFQSINQHVFC